MNRTRSTFLGITVKTLVTHTVTYFIVGLLASLIFDYARFFTESSLSLMMRPTSDPWVMAGPLFQPFRGILFGIVFYLLREPFFEKMNGWLIMWLALVVMGIIGAFGPAPGSLEGMIYTTLPLSVHLRSLPEILIQSLFLSLILFYWVNHPEKRWLNWVMGIAFAVVIALPLLGLMAGAAA